VIGGGVSGAWARQWGDATGKYTIEAAFVEYKDGQVWLKRQQDGKIVPVSMAKLRLQDQQYVVKLMMLQGKGGDAEAAKTGPAPAAGAPQTEPATKKSAATEAEPAAVSAAEPEPMFKVVKSEIVTKSVEVNGCRVPVKGGSVLYVCTIDFTKAGMTLSPKAIGEMKVAKISKALSKASKMGNIISKGDFALRLDDATTVPCYCLPAGDSASGLPIRPPRVRGGDNWLMYCGKVRLLAPVKPEAKPEALVWGATYEAKILPPGTEPPEQPATAVAQAPTASKAAADKAKPARGRDSDTARREQRARRMAVLKNGVLRDLTAKHPELASPGIAPQLAAADEFWNDKDEFNSAAFEAFFKHLMGR
jgi:hypothetical protein